MSAISLFLNHFLGRGSSDDCPVESINLHGRQATMEGHIPTTETARKKEFANISFTDSSGGKFIWGMVETARKGTEHAHVPEAMRVLNAKGIRASEVPVAGLTTARATEILEAREARLGHNTRSPMGLKRRAEQNQRYEAEEIHAAAYILMEAELAEMSDEQLDEFEDILRKEIGDPPPPGTIPGN